VDFYEADPSENPTVRPSKLPPERIPIPGEYGIYIVGVQENPHL
jgi:hypothetical protein